MNSHQTPQHLPNPHGFRSSHQPWVSEGHADYPATDREPDAAYLGRSVGSKTIVENGD